VKKLRKSVNIRQSYHKNKRVSFFLWPTVYILYYTIVLIYTTLYFYTKINTNTIALVL